MVRSPTLALVSLLAAGASCKEQPKVTRDTATSTATKSASPTPVDAPASPRAIDGYPSPLDASGPGCTLSGEWDYEQPRTLRFRPSSPPFATLRMPATVELSLLEGPTPVAFAELSSKKVRAFGFIAEEIALHAARPFIVDGYLVAARESRFVWRGASGGKVAIELDVGKFVVPKSPPRDERTCGELTLSEASFFARDAIPEATEKSGQLPPHRRFAIRKDLTGPPVAELDTSRCSVVLVDVIDHSGLDARVVIHPCSMDPILSYLVVGWVPASLILTNESGTGGSWAYGGGFGFKGTGRKRVMCPNEVPLVAEQSGEMHLVATMTAGGTLTIMSPPVGDYVAVLPNFGFEPAAGVRLLTKESALSTCTPE